MHIKPIAPSAPLQMTLGHTEGHSSPDADLIRKASDLIQAQIEIEEKTRYMQGLRPEDFTAADRALEEEAVAASPAYLASVEEISQATPTTQAGLLAQASVILWHSQAPYGLEEKAAFALAESVHRVLGAELPVWIRR